MENNQSNEVSPPRRWQILRQHSEKFVEDVVLPKSQRSIQRSSIAKDFPLQDVEAEGHYIPSSTTEIIPQRQPKYFPVFMIGISFVQVLLMYTMDNEILIQLYGYDPFRRHEPWRFITMSLVHPDGFSHLCSNVFLQLILGVLLETIHHWELIAIIYLGSVLGGSLFITVISSTRYAIGASGGCYGLLFAHLSTIILNWNEMERKYCTLFFILLYIICDIGLNLYLELILIEEPYTSYSAHLGGAITGFLIAILVLKNFEKHPWEEKMQKICVGILSAVCVIVFLVNIAAPDLYLPAEWNFYYNSTFDRDTFKVLLELPVGKLFRSACELQADCKLSLDQYTFNGTLNRRIEDILRFYNCWYP